MPDNKSLSTKVDANLLSDLVCFFFSLFSSSILLHFHESILLVPLTYLMYFLAGINTKQYCNSPE